MVGLYIHIPFCLAKCKYCDFCSFAACEKDKKRYIDALIREMKEYQGTACDTIFVGGGTPTSLESAELARLLDSINENFVIADSCEFTVEANPKTLNEEKLQLLIKGGVNRLSVGVQSFNDNELCAIGRIHSAKDAVDTISLAKDCGFDNISIDLMSAIPNQTKESFERSLDEAISQRPKHISCYSLILEEGTPLFDEYKRGELELADEDAEREMYELACRKLAEAGYRQYEISNFAKQGAESRHNKKYWNCEEYIGVGLSAHSYLGGVRFSNTTDFECYINGEYERERAEISKEEQMSEFMFLGLRKTCGISKSEFYDRFELEIEKVFEKPLLKFKNMGMIIEENGFLRLSHNAISVSNTIMCEFVL